MFSVFRGSEMNIRDLLALSYVPGIGPNRLRTLVSYFGEPRLVFESPPTQLAKVEGIEHRTALALVGHFRGAAAGEAQRFADVQLARVNRVHGRIVTFWDAEYPDALKRIYDPPPMLFLQGGFADADSCSIAIVGTRTPSSYGTHMAERFATDLARLGLPVVSGLARGIDTTAHASALRAGGRTLSVIGSGIDLIYPPENSPLAERIAATGAVISECAAGTKPDAGNFPRRNRIISGIALATVIIETGVDGGAMITASSALDQNREVFALPSPVDGKRRSGTNLLIKEGRAMLVESVDDIVAELAPRLNGVIASNALPKKPPPDISLFERRLIDALGDDTLYVDDLADRSGLSAADTLVHLLSIEFKGVVRQMPGKLFARR